MNNTIMIFSILFSLSAEAEIYREAKVCNESGKICFYWWPKLKAVPGWEQDIPHSYHYRMNTQAPAGFSFANAEAVIYARAVYKPEQPDAKTLDAFIANDKADFLSHDPSLSITRSETLKDKKGRSFISYQFKPSGKGNWEQIAYSEEVDGDNNEYYLVFVLSSRTESGYKASLDAFNQFVTSYE